MYVDTIDKAVQALSLEVEKLKKQANDQFPKIAKLNKITRQSICSIGTQYAFKYKNYYGSYKELTSEQEVDKKLLEYKESMDTIIQSIEDQHAQNIPLIENNIQVREKVSVLLKFIGFDSVYYKSYYKTPNSRKKTTETITSGWLQDLSRLCPVDDGYQYEIRQVRESYATLERLAQTEKDRIRKESAEKEKVEKKTKEVMALARLQVKYDLSEDSSWIDVLEALDKKCKYFALARALEDQRGDWSEGFGRAQNAIDSFRVETEEDKEIHEEIYALAYDDDEPCDGRVFRDCTHNYNWLYSKVDSELLQDYSALKEYYNNGY